MSLPPRRSGAPCAALEKALPVVNLQVILQLRTHWDLGSFLCWALWNLLSVPCDPPQCQPGAITVWPSHSHPSLP